MKKISFMFLCLGLVLGCNEESQLDQKTSDNITVENGRLVFKDTDLYFQTIESLGKMDGKALKDWSQQHSFNSLMRHFESIQGKDVELTPLEETYISLPTSYLMVLNKDGEVKIGDQIVWYEKSAKHYVSNEEELREVKADPSKSKNRGHFSIASKALEGNDEAHGRKSDQPPLVLGSVWALQQHQFTYSCVNSSTRKYVNELNATLDEKKNNGNGFSYHTILYLSMKLEWLSSKGWKDAGEYRFFSYNFNSHLLFVANGTPPNYVDTNYTSGLFEQNGVNNVVLFEGKNDYFNGDDAPYYDVTITGTIYNAISQSQPPAPGGIQCNGFTFGSSSTSVLFKRPCVGTQCPPNYGRLRL
jgi:hypothetical protein